MSGNTEPRRVTIWRWLDSDKWHIRWPGEGPALYGPFFERLSFVEQSAYDALVQDCERLACRADEEHDRADALAAENAALREALGEAIDLAEEGWGYDATGYFRKKHGVDGDLATLRATLANPEREQALTQLARDAQDAGAYDDPIQAASRRHFGYAGAAEDAYQRAADAKNKETDA